MMMVILELVQRELENNYNENGCIKTNLGARMTIRFYIISSYQNKFWL
jgi:hypothetical protein